MASHIDTKLERVTTGKTRGPTRKIIAPMPKGIDDAVRTNRAPTTDELFEECKVVMGVTLIGLRSGRDAVKVATAVAQITRAVAQIAQIEKIEEISDSALQTMSEEELKEYAVKLIDKIK